MCKPTVLKLLSLHFQYSAQKLSKSGHLFHFETNSECLKAPAGFPGLLRAGAVSRAGQTGSLDQRRGRPLQAYLLGEWRGWGPGLPSTFWKLPAVHS